MPGIRGIRFFDAEGTFVLMIGDLPMVNGNWTTPYCIDSNEEVIGIYGRMRDHIESLGFILWRKQK